eukprot:7022023-Lingulodinium_polyedra.AAC.1
MSSFPQSSPVSSLQSPIYSLQSAVQSALPSLVSKPVLRSRQHRVPSFPVHSGLGQSRPGSSRVD